MIKKLFDFWFSLPDKIRFLFVGGFNFVFAYFLFVIILLLTGENHYQLSLVLSWILSSFVSFTTQRIFVFRSNGKIIKEYFKCLTTWMLSYAVNAILLEILVKYIHVQVFLSQIIAVSAAAVVTYILFKHFAFKSKKEA